MESTIQYHMKCQVSVLIITTVFLCNNAVMTTNMMLIMLLRQALVLCNVAESLIIEYVNIYC